MGKKIVFISSADPFVNPGNVWRAFHYADVATEAGVEAEVRLVADAVKVCMPYSIPDTEKGEKLRNKITRIEELKYIVTLCPVSSTSHELSESDRAAVGGKLKEEVEFLNEVADGTAELVHLG